MGGLYSIAFELFERYAHCSLADLNVHLWLNRSIGPGRQADQPVRLRELDSDWMTGWMQVIDWPEHVDEKCTAAT